MTRKSIKPNKVTDNATHKKVPASIGNAAQHFFETLGISCTKESEFTNNQSAMLILASIRNNVVMNAKLRGPNGTDVVGMKNMNDLVAVSLRQMKSGDFILALKVTGETLANTGSFAKKK
jgi:hypothetical protein